VTHLVIDEVHERSCDNDLLLSVVRVLLGRRKIKVVLMSATLAVDTLTMYFAEAGCTIGAVSIVGHTFPVDRLYLSDAIELSGYTCPTGSATGFSRPEVTEAVLRERNGTGPTDDDRGTVEAAAEQPPAIADAPMTIGQRMIVENLAARSAKERRVKENSAVGVGSIGGIAQAWIDRVGQAGMREYDQRLKKASNRTLDTLRTLDHSLNPVNTDLITALIRWLVTSSNSKGSTKSNPGTGTFGKAYDGAVLIFMPGLFEILDLVAALQRDSVLGKDSSFLILPLHSELSTEEQKRVFVRPPPGFTKIVVATNIAEASITIDDVTCVIDGGGHKEVRYDPHTSLTSLRLVRIAETNATQRAGRAGRVRAGVCFHLYMRREVLEPQQQSEVQRSPLEPLCLRAKALGLGGIKAALAALPTPPKLGAVDHAMRVLTGLQLIEPCASTTVEAAVDPTQWTQETLSPLGSVLASLPASPRAGKVAVLGAVFGCLEPMLVIAAALDVQSVFAAPRTHHESANRAKRELDPTSDHIAVLKAYRTWSRIRARGSGGEEKRYLSEMFLSRQGMCGIEKTSKQLRAALRSAGLVPKEGGLERHSDNMAFIKALLASSVYPGVATVTTSRHAAREPGTPPTLALRTAELYGKKPVRKQLNNKVVYLHPSTVLSGSQAHIVGRVLAESKDSMAPRPLIAFSSRMKTTRDFVSDATLIGPMELLLFAGLDVVVESSDTADDCDDGGEDAVAASTRSAADEAADTEVHVTLDRWLQFRLSSRNADLLLRLRYDLADVMRQKLGGVVGICNAAGELASRVIAVAARILQTTGVGDDDTGWPLPEGWRHEDDPTSSIGRLLYFNTISGAAQRERPTAPAQRGVGTRSGAPAAQSRGAAHKPNQSHRNKANSASVELSAEDLVAKAQAKEVADSGERDAKAAKAQAAAGRKIQEDAAAATAAVNSKAEAEANKSATLRLAREHEAAVATSASQRHTTVANLLAHLELEHYAEKFAAANIDDATLCDLIDFVEDDADEAAGELDAMIESVGAKGGAAVRLRQAMLSKNPAGGGGGGKGRGGQGRGGLGGRGNGGGRGRNNRGRGRQESGKKKK
jgi:ATP-dependent RNA helicase DHX57